MSTIRVRAAICVRCQSSRSAALGAKKCKKSMASFIRPTIPRTNNSGSWERAWRWEGGRSRRVWASTTIITKKVSAKSKPSEHSMFKSNSPTIGTFSATISWAISPRKTRKFWRVGGARNCQSYLYHETLQGITKTQRIVLAALLKFQTHSKATRRRSRASSMSSSAKKMTSLSSFKITTNTTSLDNHAKTTLMPQCRQIL